jgi:hypothetical protein
MDRNIDPSLLSSSEQLPGPSTDGGDPYSFRFPSPPLFAPLPRIEASQLAKPANINETYELPPPGQMKKEYIVRELTMGQIRNEALQAEVNLLRSQNVILQNQTEILQQQVVKAHQEIAKTVETLDQKIALRIANLAHTLTNKPDTKESEESDDDGNDMSIAGDDMDVEIKAEKKKVLQSLAAWDSAPIKVCQMITDSKNTHDAVEFDP